SAAQIHWESHDSPGSCGPEVHLDGFAGKVRPAADLARTDGAQGTSAMLVRLRLGRTRLSRGRSAARHRRRAPYVGAGRSANGGCDRFDTAGLVTSNINDDPANVSADTRSHSGDRREYELLHLPALQFTGLYIRTWRRQPGSGTVGHSLPG